MKKFVSIIMTMVMVSLFTMSNISVSFAEITLSAPTIYVSRDSATATKDYYCDGTDDQEQINNAINYVLTHDGYNTIHLEPGTYTIDNTILMGGKSDDSVYLEGEGDNTVIKLQADPADWVEHQAMIEERSGYQSNIVIRNLKLDGNGSAFTTLDYDDPDDRGHNMYNIMYLQNCTKVEVYGMTLTHNFNDGLKLKECTNVTYRNNLIDEIGHDGLYAVACDQVYAYSNRIYIQTNSGLRIDNSNDVEFHDNVISTRSGVGGGAGIEIQKTGNDAAHGGRDVNNVKIYNNTIFDTDGSGIWLFSGKEADQTYSLASVNAEIHNNLIYNCGSSTRPIAKGGICSHGFNATIYNNTIDRCFKSGIYTEKLYSLDAPTQTTSYTLTVKNSIISNVQHTESDATGIGLYNNNSKNKIVSTFNCVYNNKTNTTLTNYNGVTKGTGDFTDKDPLFANPSAGDYHLQSRAGRSTSSGWDYYTDSNTSPCIDAGEQSSNYTNEPLFNGGRVNIGAYGNTIYASKSPCKIKNTLTNEYMHNEYTYNQDNGFVQCSSLGSPGWWSARWTFHDLGDGYYKIQSVYSRKWMNTEHHDWYVQCDADDFGWAAQWYMVNDGNGNYYFKNRYRNTYMNMQNQYDHVELSSTLNNSSYWILETAPKPY